MLDYRANIAALDVFRQTLASANVTDPHVATIRDEQIGDVDSAPHMALLGALVDQLIWHAASDGAELLLLERAAELWKQGLALYKKMGEFRSGIEGALGDPTNPNSVQQFNDANKKLQEFQAGLGGKEVEVAVLRDDIFDAAHPHSHPRQEDEPLEQWGWSDIFLARRTDAFARAVWMCASTGPHRAFAFGVMSSYGANACGSAYLGQVVGGPRRAHRHRDRMARNAVGSWFALSYPNVASLTGIADSIRYGLLTPTLPPGIETLITDALTETYDLGRTPQLPDLQLGYKRLLRHLKALDAFVIPGKPAMPIEPFLTKAYGDTANPSYSMMEAIINAQNLGASGSGSGSGVTPQSGPMSGAVGQQDSRRNSRLDCGAFFMALLQWTAGSTFLWAPCWEVWYKGEDCKLWEGMKHDFAEWWASLGGGQGAGVGPPAGTDTNALTAAVSKDITDFIRSWYDAHNHFRETLNSAYAYLSSCGLIYPDALLSLKLYSQFLAIPPFQTGGWPHRAVADSADQAHVYPTTPIEQPAIASELYPVGAAPSIFLTGAAPEGPPTAARVSTRVWMQTARRELGEEQNHDLDADRGLLHPCWATDGSIDDDPVNVEVLDYDQT
ncbi:hypothetical protein [Nocardia fluminea]|uniref:hypothetical protein n=1 Tax=Nocardia fluminea TaxID=134984 RepID=UPI003658FEF1